MSDVTLKDGFQKRAWGYGLPKEVAAKLPEEAPARDKILDALLDAGAEPGDATCTLEGRLIAFYHPVAAPEAKDDGPKRIILEQEKITPQILVERINGGERTLDNIEALDRAVKGAAVFVTKSDGTLDVEALTQALAHIAKHGQAPEKIAGRTPRTLRAALATVEPMNPMTGQPLDPGDKWYGVAKENRVYVAWLAMCGKLVNFAEPIVREAAAKEKVGDTVIGDGWADFEALDATDEERVKAHNRAFKKSGDKPKPAGGANPQDLADVIESIEDPAGTFVAESDTYASHEGTRSRADKLPWKPDKFMYDSVVQELKGLKATRQIYQRNLANDKKALAQKGYDMALTNSITIHEATIRDSYRAEVWLRARLGVIIQAIGPQDDEYSGAVAQGRGAVAVGAGSVVVGGNVSGSIISGNDVTIDQETWTRTTTRGR